MTDKSSGTKLGYVLAALSLGLLVSASTIAGGLGINAANAQQIAPKDTPAAIQHAPPLPVLTSTEEQVLFGIAKNVPGIKAWSADGWQLLTIDFMGNTTPVKWTNAIVRLKLPPAANAQEYCYEGWEAMVKINLETKVVEETDYPSKTNNQCGGHSK